MRILIANDDGIYSPGLAALAEIASRFGDVRVVAPDVEQSSMGHAITHSRPLSYRPTPVLGRIEAYRVNGTPADCVTLGAFLWERIDLVLSGINLGPNIGHGIWHSGTLAAAKQAALLGLRGIALSTPVGKSEPDFAALAPWVERVLRLLIEDRSMCLVNVNFPQQPVGMCWTSVSVRHYDGRVVPTDDPMGRRLHWLSVRPIEEADEGSDRWAVRQGLVSITPLRLDLTDHALLAEARRASPLEAGAPSAATTGATTEDDDEALEEATSEASG
jgi:5'-nucleotidase